MQLTLAIIGAASLIVGAWLLIVILADFKDKIRENTRKIDMVIRRQVPK